MDYYGRNITSLIEALRGLPGIGQKSAQRMAFHIVGMPKEEALKLSEAIRDARENVRFCKMCQTVTDEDICPICKSTKRDHKKIMVVETPRDLAAYEKTGQFDGVYHVLHGCISPMLGIGPNDIRLRELLTRLQELDSAYEEGGERPEAIIALGATVEGESTAMYIHKLAKTLSLNVKITRIASGIPVGGDIENVDEVTLERALKGRTELS